MHVLPSEDVFYIVNVNAADAGTADRLGLVHTVYVSCRCVHVCGQQ